MSTQSNFPGDVEENTLIAELEFGDSCLPVHYWPGRLFRKSKKTGKGREVEAVLHDGQLTICPQTSDEMFGGIVLDTMREFGIGPARIRVADTIVEVVPVTCPHEGGMDPDDPHFSLNLNDDPPTLYLGIGAHPEDIGHSFLLAIRRANAAQKIAA